MLKLGINFTPDFKKTLITLNSQNHKHNTTKDVQIFYRRPYATETEEAMNWLYALTTLKICVYDFVDGIV